ncbi:MAG: helicase-related protein [Armatimonadetes bacterium]|nr:helicase-related protein [Armatimonadota bacterium]
MWIATSYFKPDGYPLVADVLEQAREVRLLIGAAPEPLPPRPRKPGEGEEEYNAALVEEALKALQEGLCRDRDLLGFSTQVDARLQRLIEFLRRETTQVRLYRRQFLHGKSFIFPDGGGVIVGSSNFTAGGLCANLELNLGRYDPEPVAKVEGWFEELWAEAEPFDLAEVYEARFEPYAPYLIYLRVLWELYGADGEELERAGVPLTDFQQDGLVRAERILGEYSGVLIADGVGLGKTYIAGELIRKTIYERRQKVLLIAPAALRDGTWKTFFDKHAIHCETVSYEELAAEPALGGSGNPKLRCDPGEYALIVIDEAQAFRNPNTRRADALRRLLSGEPAKNVVMMSATPVNNTLWDLYYLLSYFLPNDAAFSGRGILSLRRRFEEATQIDPYELKPDVLFDVLDAICVRRTRHFVRKWYPDAKIPNARGELVPVRFPKPQLRRVDYRFEDVLPKLLDQLEAALAPAEGEPKLTMARYEVSRYRKDRARAASRGAAAGEAEELAEPYERQLAGLLRSALLKRFESSAYAFRRTLETMIRAHENFLRALECGYVVRGQVVAELEDVDSDEALEDLLREADQESASLYDTEELRSDVMADRQELEELLETAEEMEQLEDPKLEALADKLRWIGRQAEKDGFDDKSIRDNRKVLIFSYYADTVDWIERYLRDLVERDEGLACYRGRIASVTSDDSRGGVSRADAIYGFAPESTDAPAGRREDRFDILICTDVLAEGMNLQQCRHVVNFDLPWNPMRIVQRNGRIDRIGSPHERVFAHCFFPDERLEELLALEERIRRKLAQAAASVGMETAPVPGAPTGAQVFAETREEIERLRREDPTLLETAGEDVSAYSGEEYRQELSAGMKKYGRQVRELPWAAGSGYAATGKARGWAFCAKVDKRVFLRFVPAGSATVERDTLRCLKQFTCEENTARVMPEDLRQGVYDAWQQARADIHAEWMAATDPKNLQPQVPRIFREMADHLRRYPPIGVTKDAVDDLCDRLEAPWPRRIQSAFRDLFPPTDEREDPRETSRKIADLVRKLGLRPFKPPAPLPAIDEEQIMLICWMAVETG